MNKIYGITCCDLIDPQAVDSVPRFSWKYELDGGYQSLFRIEVNRMTAVGRDEKIWHTGSVKSDECTGILYEGPALEPLCKYTWKVTAADEAGNHASAVGRFGTGFLGSQWEAKWISASYHKKHDASTDAPYLRRGFHLDEKPVSAMLYICSPGFHDAYVNGAAACSELMSPPYTAFDRTLYYSAYDVTDMMRAGENAIGVLIGTGWYNSFAEDVWNARETSWRHVPKVIAELHIISKDGSRNVVPTDSRWKCSQSPIIFNGIRNGEFYDARLEEHGWNRPELNDDVWKPVKVIRPPGGLLKAMEMEPERIVSSSETARFWETPEGAWVFESKRNMAGFAQITVMGASGDEVKIRYSERLEEDGIHIDRNINAGFLRSGDFQTDKYIKKSNEPETWHPRFVYHGFQYAEISGCAERPVVTFQTVNTDVSPMAGFVSSDETLNSVQEAARTATLSNLHGIPTDDPHREKNAWTGDVSLSAEQMLYNFHIVPLFRKWLGDIRDAQRPDGAIPCVVPSTGWGYNWGNGPDWSSALTLIPWYIYVMTGDKSILRENYPAIKKHLSYIDGQAEDYIVSYGIGDWCPPFEGGAVSASMSSFKAPVEVTDTAYYHVTAVTTGKIAKILGLDDESSCYLDKAARIKKAFRKRFYDGGAIVAGDCQTSTACMLYQGLTDGEETNRLTDYLKKQIIEKEYHQDTGILGNKYIYNVLGESGHMDLALRMILNETYPSFGNWIRMGATTLWECWNGEASRNHHMFSDVSAVFYKYLAGIKPDENEPGFKHIVMEPDLNCGLEYVKAWHETPYGKVECDWRVSEDSAEIMVTVPCGCRATFRLPDNFDASCYEKNLAAGMHKFSVRKLGMSQ